MNQELRTKKKQQVITAVVFLYNDKGEVLLAKRTNELSIFPGIYELPGGHIEFGELIEDGLRREMREEFSLEVKIGQPFHVFTYLNTSQTKHVVEIVYFAELVDQNSVIKLSNEHSSYKWVEESEVETCLKKNNPAEFLAAKRGFQIINKKGVGDG